MKMKNRLTELSEALLIGLIYFLSLWGGYLVRYIGQLPPVIWFANGVGVAVFILCGNRFWPALFLAEFIFRLMRDASGSQYPYLTCFISAAGVVFGEWLGVTLFLRSIKVKPTFTRVTEVVSFIVCVLGIGFGTGTAIQMLALFIADFNPLYSTGFAWRAWWIDGNIGAIVVGAGAVTFWNDTRHNFRRYQKFDWQLIVALVVTVAIGIFVYTPFAVYNTSVLFRQYLLFTCIIWASLRYDILGAWWVTTLTVACATAGILAHYVPSSSFEHLEDQILVYELFIMVLGMTGLVFAAAIREREEAAEAKNLFLANMSHELRTPLGVILGFAELLASQDATESEKIKWAKLIERNGNHLLRIIEDILDLSKIESRKLAIECSSFLLSDLIIDILKAFSSGAEQKNIQLVFENQKEAATQIYSDPARIRQVLDNIINNAIKFTDHGKIEVQVRVESSIVSVRVIDTGIGIPAKQQQKLFKAFSQADNTLTRKYGGTGLGLALSKRIAMLLGGDLLLIRSRTNSEAAHGSEFEFTFAKNKCLEKK